MSLFKEYTLQDVISLVIDYRGKTPKKLGGDWSESGYRALSAKNVKTGKIVQPDTIRYVSEDMYRKWMKDEVEKGDIFITSEAPFGQIYYWDSDEKIVLSQRLFAVRTRKEFYDKYIYFYMTTPFFQAELENRSTGTTVTGLRQPELLKTTVIAPDYETQVKIADFLYEVEKKININEAINRNLSEQAQALYKSWFVDLNPFEGERPADWQDGTVDDLASEVVCGKTPSTKKEEYYGNDIPFVTIPDMHGCVYTIHTERSLSELGAESQSKKTLPKNSICVSCIGTAGLVTLLPVPSQTNQQINSIIPKDNYSPYYIYLLMSTMRETINKLGQAGSTIVNLNKTQFGKIEVLIPSIKTMSDFDEIVEPVFSAILSNQIENEKLANLRDSLLPKLMSGEIDVSDLEI